MLFRHIMSIAQQLMPIYNTTVHKNKSNVAFNLMWLLTVGVMRRAVNLPFQLNPLIEIGNQNFEKQEYSI